MIVGLLKYYLFRFGRPCMFHILLWNSLASLYDDPPIANFNKVVEHCLRVDVKVLVRTDANAHRTV